MTTQCIHKSGESSLPVDQSVPSPSPEKERGRNNGRTYSRHPIDPSPSITFTITTKKISGALVGAGCSLAQLRELAAASYRSFALTTATVDIKRSPIQAIYDMRIRDNAFREIGLTSQEMVRLIRYWRSLVGDPWRFLRLLEPIERQLADCMAKDGLSFNEEEVAPRFLISGKGCFLLGPPPNGEKGLQRTGGILENILLKREREMDINREGTSVFMGNVEPRVANSFVAAGHIFRENVHISRLLLHGKNSHRLFFQALIESIRETEFERLTPRGILKLLIALEINGVSAWIYFMDTNHDLVEPVRHCQNPGEELTKVENFCYSCRSPFVFNSLLVCFGDTFGLPNLMRYMRNSHWKAAGKMVKRFDQGRVNTQGIRVHPESLYVLIMEALAAPKHGINNIGESFPFSSHKWSRGQKEKYENYPGQHRDSGIKIKKRMP